MVPTGVPPLIPFTQRISELAAWSETDNDMTPTIVLTIHQKAEMGEEDSVDEGMRDVGRNELPCEVPA
jgi:hypothetical protein